MVRQLLFNKLLFFAAVLFVALSFKLHAQNNACSGAINLSVGQLTCNYALQNNNGATPDSGVPAPACVGYVEEDTWFQFTVPASGSVTIDMQTGTVTDMGMALYSGTCGALVPISCDDDSSPNGLMPRITASGLTGGSVLYVRVWEFGGDFQGTFGICVQDNNPVSTCGQTCSGPPPANDICSGAYNIGTLPAPPPCSAGGGTGLQLTAPAAVSTNLCATAGDPYTFISSCIVGGGQDNPAADVWFSFTATSTDLVVNLTSSMQGANIALYSGTCSNLSGFGCVSSSNGNITQTFSPLSSGNVYYLQVSGSTPNDRCNFSLALRNNRNCSYCIQQSTMTFDPQPGAGAAPPGTYLPGTTVEFCYTIQQYNQTGSVNVNWLHSVVPQLGPGWNPATLTPTSFPNSCSGSGSGNWGWYTSVTGNGGASVTVGPGFFYDANSGGGSINGNPGDNWGDPGNCNWTFCWEVTSDVAAQCIPTNDLNITVAVYADSQTGSWTQPGCQQDPDYPFFANPSCCDLLVTMGGGGYGCFDTPVPVNIAFDDTNFPDGPWTFTYTQNGGSPVTVTTTNNPYTFNATTPGVYQVQSASNGDCVTGGSGQANVTYIPLVTAQFSPPTTVCAGSNLSILVSGSGSSFNITYTNTTTGVVNNITTSTVPYVITAPTPGSYVINSISAVVGSLSCPGTVSGAGATVISAPVANAGADQNLCSLTATLAGNGVTSPATGTWTLVTPAPGTANFSPNATTANASVTVSTPGSYSFRWTTAQGTCSTNDVVVINFAQPVANAGTDQPSVCGLTATLAGNTPTAGFTGQWAQTGGPGTANFSAGATPASNVTVTVPGTYTFQWQVGNGSCSVSDLVSVTFINTTANAGADQNSVCSLTATLGGNSPASPATGLWTIISGPGTSSLANPSANNSSVTVTQAGTYVYQWTVSNSTCSQNDQVSITFVQTTAAAGADQSNVCGLTGTLAATATTAPAVGAWTQLSGPGTSSFTNAASATSGVTVTQGGNYTFTWTVSNGACTASDNVNVTFRVLPSAVISGGGAICNDGVEEATFSILLTGTAPFDFSYNNAGSNTIINDYVGANPYTFSTTQAGNFSVTSISDASGCVGTVSGSATVTLTPLPTATIGGTTTICSGQSASLPITLTGASPYTVIYSDGAVNYTLNGSSPLAVSVSPNATTTYSIVSVTDNNGCANTSNSTATVTINPAPQVNFATLVTPCDATGNFYTVSFNISGGNGSYTVTPAGGTIAGNTYTSAQIPSGTPYNFTVDDSNNCNPISVSGTYTCGCSSNAGQMQVPAVTPVEFCSSQNANATHVANSETLDGDDTFMYVLHTNAGAAIGGTPLATNATGSFAFNSATMTYGTTYYISYVVGDNLGANNVDLTDNCLSVAAGVPIAWVQPPTASTGAPIATCGLTAAVSANTPAAGMIGTWTSSSPNVSFANINAPSTNITASAPGNYTLTWTVSNPPCAVATATVAANFAATPVLSAGTNTCDYATATTDLPFVIISGTAPYTVSASNGISITGTGSNRTANDIPNGTTFTVTVSDNNSCSATASFGPFNCDCPFVPSPENLQNPTYCPGGTPQAVSVDAAPAGYTIQWYTPASGTVAVATGTTYTPTTGGVYFVDIVDNATGCRSPQTTVLVLASAAVDIAQQAPICAPDLVSYSAQLTVSGGNAPYSLSSNSGTIADLGGGVFTISNVAEGTNIVATATDNNTCTATANITSPNCNCPTIAAPTANSVSYCNGETPPPISVSSVPAGFSVAWFNAPTGGTPVSTDNPFTPTTAGTYYAELTQTVNGCVSSRTAVSVTENAPIGVVAGVGVCANDLQTYDISVTINGGAQPFSVTEANGYVVSGSGNSFTINDVPLGVGTTINVVDANNCNGSGTGVSPVCACPNVPEPVPSNNLYCAGTSLTPLSIAAPPAGHTAIWYSDAAGTNQVATGNTFLPSSAGTYYVALEDNTNNCLSDIVSATLSQSPAIIFTNGSSTCAANLQSYNFDFTVSGGTAPYTVSSSAGTQSGGAGGNYSVSNVPIVESVTINISDDNGCVLPAQLVTPPVCPCPTIAPPTATDASISFCAGDLPASLSVTDPGVGYVVYWYNTPIGGVAIESGNTYQPGGQGTFYAEVGLTINACRSARTAFTVTQNALPTIAAGLPACATNLETYQLDVTITGTAPFTVTADAPATVTPVSATVFTIGGIESNFTNNVSVTDGNGCEASEIVGPQNCDCPIINSPSDPVGNVFCAGEGETQLSVDPAPAGYEIVWYASFFSTTPLGTGPNFTPTGLGAGTYYAAVENISNDCVSQRTEVVLTMNSPTPPVFNGLAAQYCSNTAAITLSGTATPVGGTFTIDGTSATSLNPATLSAGNHTLAYSYTNASGCDASGTFNFAIVAPLAAPVVSCGATTTNSVTFNWAAIAGAVSYNLSISINGGAPISQNTTLLGYTQSSLAAGDVVSISVTAVGGATCGNSPAGTANCSTGNCPTITPTIDNLDTEYCSDGFPINLTGTPAGGTWSGTGVTGSNIFNPIVANVGVNVITYDYTDAATGCDYQATASTTVAPALTAPIITCSSTVNSVTFNWTNLGPGITYNLTIQINNGATLSQNNVASNTYTAPGLNEGDDVAITVVANGIAPCGNSPIANGSCSAQNCPVVNVTINGVAAAYCADDAAFTLSGTPAGGVFSGTGVTGAFNDQFNPASVGMANTTLVYTYADANGCQYQAQQTINIATPLAAPVINCSNATTSQITFNWTNIGVTTYNVSVSVNGGAPNVAVVNATTYTQNGLSADDEVTISVVGVGTAPCGNSPAGTQTCTAQACPSIVPVINVATEYCSDDSPITLSAIPAGGTFSGSGVTGTQFNPAIVPVGTSIITYNYTDAITGCAYSNTANVTIVAPLNAPTVTCQSSTTNSVTFGWTNVGASSYNLSISVNGGAPTTQGVTGTSYTVNGLAVNDEVTISVSGVGVAPCGDSPAGTQTCSAEDCPAQVITINGLAATYCTDDAPISLSATPAGGTFSGNGVSGNTFTPSVAGAGTVAIVYDYTDPVSGCSYQEQVSTVLVAPLTTPVVSCGTATATSVTFNWTNLGVAQYQVTYSINGGLAISETLLTPQLIVPDLLPDDVVNISVIAVGAAPCGNSAAGTGSCTAQSCPTINTTINGLAASYCADAAAVILNGTPAGGVWSGSGVVGNQFIPSNAGAGVATITYTYTDPATQCESVASEDVDIIDPIEVPEVLCSSTTTNSVTFAWSNVGAINYTITVDVNGVPGVPFTTINTTYTQNGLTEGNDVTISVVANASAPCGSSAAATQTCTAQDCPAQVLTIDGLATEYCISDAAVTLTTTPSGGVLSGDGITGDQFSPADAGLGNASITYTYTDAVTGCPYSTVANTIVRAPLATPVVTCSTTTTSSVGFTWGNINGASSYELSISVNAGAASTQTVNATTYTQNGLSIGDSVTITVTAIGTGVCGNSPASAAVTCQTQDCPAGTPTINLASNEFCVSGAAITLTANPAGGTWSGTGVSGNQFDPAVAGIGAYTITYDYTDPTSGCAYSNTADVTVSDALPTPIVSCGTITATSLTFTWTGNPLNTYSLSVSVNGGAATQETVVGNSYTINGLGTSDEATIIVTANGTSTCGDSPASTPVSCNIGGCPTLALNIALSDTLYCVGETPITLTATPEGGTWSGNGVSGSNFNPSTAGAGTHNLVYNYTDPLNSCTYSDSISVSVSSVVITPMANVAIEPGTEYTLSADATSGLDGALSLTWTDNLGTVLDSLAAETPIVAPTATTTYTVTVTDEYGCSSTATQTLSIVTVALGNVAAMPSAFSPNGDGTHELFRIKGANIASIEMTIFNRWGQQLYYLNTAQGGSISLGWDGKYEGKDMEIGVYVYYVRVVYNDGEEQLLKGNTTLIR